MKLALIQMNSQWESKKANLKKANSFVRRASSEACDIIVFPEMFNSGFSLNFKSTAEDHHGESWASISCMAKKYKINLIAGITGITGDAEKGLNMAVVHDRKGNIIAKYVKLHPFSFAGEDQFFSPGNSVVTFRIEGMDASIFICYDLRFPEVFRSVAKNVQAIFVIANWPYERIDHWETLLKARAIENQCFIIGVNRTGTDGNGLKYSGASAVFDPLGKKICQGGENAEFVVCEINPHIVPVVRAEYPFLKDMKYFKKK